MTVRAWWRVLIVSLLVFAASVTVLIARADAHTEQEKSLWWTQWHRSVELAGGMTPGLLAEAQEFIERHEVAPSRPEPARPRASAGQGMGSGDVERWRGLVASYGGWNVDTMLCLMAKESGGNPNAKNPRSSATGLFQIMASVWGPEYPGNLYDPAHNVYVARQVWARQGYGAWSPYRRGACRG